MKAEQQPPSKGERWLEMIGYAHMSEQPTKFVDENDQPILCRDFYKLCEGPASKIFTAIELTDPIDPGRDADIDLARRIFDYYFAKSEA